MSLFPQFAPVTPACVALAALGGAAIGILILWVLARAPRGNGRNNE
jgi:hypothetical protein